MKKTIQKINKIKNRTYEKKTHKCLYEFIYIYIHSYKEFVYTFKITF
jgi:hypothetical protein